MTNVRWLPSPDQDLLQTTSSVDRADAASTAVVLATKLHAPTRRRQLVARPSLLRRLQAAPLAKVTLVCAPAGWGKSTLLSEWRADARQQRPFAWVSLDQADNDPVTFWTYVIEALRTLEPEVGAGPLAMLRTPGISVVEVILPELINTIQQLTRPVVLVLDDYHLITNPEIHEAMTVLLEHLPTTLHLVLATRSDPALPLPRMRVRGELVEIRAEDLRFSEQEAAGLLNDLLGLDLEAADVARLHERTEGWAAGLYLAALSLRGRTDPRQFVAAFAGDDRQVVEYLGLEVIDNQPDHIRTFLLQTSILERLSGPLCDVVTGHPGSARTLEQIERANLFLVPLDTTREWYRYHHLFGELLRHQLQRSHPKLVPTLHLRAAAWYRQHGLVPEAIDQAVAAADFVEAGELITLHWNDFVNQGHLETVDRWLQALPSDVLLGDPHLCLARAGTSLTLGRRNEVDRWLDAAEQHRGPGPVRPGGTSVASEAAIYRAVHRYMLGDLQRAAEAARRAVGLEKAGTSPWRAMASAALGRTLYWRGEDTEAVTALEEAVRWAQPPRNNLSVIGALGYLAAIQARRGDLEGAEKLARRAVRMSDEQGLAEHWVTMIGLIAWGKVLQEQARLAEAEAVMTRAVELARRGAGAVERAYSLIGLAGVRRRQGDVRGARTLLEEARQAAQRCPDPGVLSAMLADSERSLSTAAAGSWGRPVGGLVEALTDRELAVLQLLPTKRSLRQIAATLYVSYNTVKTHARAIYRKLDVSTREEAVARARDLYLL
jgi:LuxR family transcriptional regulator, maltose regulon positive regulatory protein